eukprot:SAG22_NODE_325_length_12333_cov_263.779222_2_plen_172_part_00
MQSLIDAVSNTDKVKADVLSEIDSVGATLSGYTTGTPAEQYVKQAAVATGVLSEGQLLVSCLAALLSVAMVACGLSNMVTVFAFAIPAAQSFHMLAKPEAEATKDVVSTAMPLYWIVLAVLITLEDWLAVLPWPLWNVVYKALGLVYLWKGKGCVQLQKLLESRAAKTKRP